MSRDKTYVSIQPKDTNVFDTYTTIKRAKKGYDEYEIVLILEQNIRVFLGLHNLTHGLTFGIIYFCKYYGQ